MRPDGSYFMSQAAAAQAIDEPRVYALRFLSSKASKALLGEAFTGYTPETIEVEPQPGTRGQTRVNVLPLAAVSAYWYFRGSKGNEKAFLLSWALQQETLERRFDAAFGRDRTEAERNDLLAQRQRRAERAQELATEYVGLFELDLQDFETVKRLINQSNNMEDFKASLKEQGIQWDNPEP